MTADVAALANHDALAFVPSEIVKDMLDGVAVAVQKEPHWPFAARWKCR